MEYLSEKSSYFYDKDYSIFTKKYIGDIYFTDIESSWNKAIKSNIVPLGTKRFILDYRDARFQVNHQQAKLIPAFYQKNISFFEGSKIAIVTENPSDIVIPMLVMEYDLDYQSQPFSSIAAAKNWLFI